MALKANRSSKNKPKEVYDALENIFRPESNATMSKFQFRSPKQKSDQNVDSFLADLRLALPECQYPMDSENDILKDQFIFGVNNKKIQDSLLRDIQQTDTVDTCLTAARRVESQIAQRKLLGISAKCKYDKIKQNRCHRSKSHKSGKGKFHRSQSRPNDCKYCGRKHKCGDCAAFGKTCVNAKIILQMYVGHPKTDLIQEVESRKNLMVVHAQNKITIQCIGVIHHAVMIGMLKISNLMKLNM